ncbi:HYR domain-containing protein [Abyssalbus ytuae]|uniref:HYR domain-containing protein n=1 Tax=Abyssalbus ytuae TaxID=2926907 RepID=A0A9E6ZNS0_9FLAO|nr:HYR domain-containing protein [Abyssalbus ytuae]UOB19334.1 HYR domain-containing protein [Abyssalbus ytuae]
MKKTIILFVLLTIKICVAQDCDILDSEWLTPTPKTVIYTYLGSMVTGIPDAANSVNPTDQKTVFEGFISPNPGSTPVGAASIGLGFLIDPNDNTTFDVNVYNDNGSGRPGALIGGVTGFSPTQLGVIRNNFSNFWFTFPPGIVPATTNFYIGVVLHPGDASDQLIIQSNDNGQGNGDNSNSITTTKFGNERILAVYSRDIDLNIIARLGTYGSFEYSSASYCHNEADPTPTILGTTGGLFTSTPAGLAINATTGTIDLSASNPGQYNITYSVSGTCSTQFTGMITIDNTPPTINCPGNQNGNVNALCQFVLPDYTTLATASDNCGTPVITQTPSPGTLINTNQTITLTATDSGGLTTQCTFSVILSDTTPPSITCPGDQPESFDGNCEFILPDYTGLTISSDNCSTPAITQSPVAGTVITANQTITLTADDGNGNSTPCTFEVILSDTTPPSITCPGDQPESFNSNCEFVLPDYTGLAISSDNCSSPVVIQTPAVGTVITANQTITLTADDGNGNSTPCTFEVILSDTTPPSITCPGDQPESFDSNCEFILPDYTGLAISSDNCSTPAITQTPAAGTVITTNQTITLTADDGNGNSTPCTFEVILSDTTPPSITCPGDQPESFNSNCEFVLPDYTGLAISSDNCSSPVVIQTPAVGTVITANQTITLTADDGNGNSTPCTFEVILSDTTPPSITCPGDQPESFDSNCEFILPDYTGLAISSDNCSTPAITQTPAAGTVITTNQTITLTADDGNGNSTPCTFEVILSDTTPPSITCPGDQPESFDSNCEFILPDYTGLAISSDNCSMPAITQTPAAGTVITTNQTITLTADDGNGNSTPCTFEVILSDTTPPSITCPGDQPESFDSNCEFVLPDYTGLAISSDNCSSPVITQIPVAGTVITTNQTITLTADDGNGNSTPCTFEVILSDTTPPSITCPGDQTENLDLNGLFIIPDYTFLATVTDNCSTPAITQTPVAGTVISSNQTITLIAEDSSGNMSQCAFEIHAIEKVEVQIQTGLDNPTNQSPVDISIVFSESVTDFVASDIIVSNGTVGTLTGSGMSFTAEIIPDSDGLIAVNINPDVITGVLGNGNLPSNEFTIIYDSTPPSFNAFFGDEIVNLLNEQNVGLVIENGEIGSSYNYIITSLEDSSYQVSGMGVVTSGNELFYEDLSAFPNGTIELQIVLTDEVGNESPVTTDEIQKLSGPDAQRIPQGFSPNGDGTNDVWVIPGIEQYPNNQVTVFNRYGKIIWKIKGYDNNLKVWGGETNERSLGNGLADGTYYYVIDYGDFRIRQKSGYLIIKR